MFLSFQICKYTKCSTFTASSFRIWKSSTGIPSPPPVLFVLMLPKAHLTYSRMSGSRWVIIPSWLSGSWKSFLYSSSVYSCHLFLISSASVRSIPFLSFIKPIFAWNIPFVSLIFLTRSLVFPILLFSSISLHWLLRKAFLSLLALLWNSAFRCLYLFFSPLLLASLLFTAIYKASPDSHLAFSHFFSMGMVLIPVSCTMSWTSFHSYKLIGVLFRDMKPRNRNSLQRTAKEKTHTENTMKPPKLKENTFAKGPAPFQCCPPVTVSGRLSSLLPEGSHSVILTVLMISARSAWCLLCDMDSLNPNSNCMKTTLTVPVLKMRKLTCCVCKIFQGHAVGK